MPFDFPSYLLGKQSGGGGGGVTVESKSISANGTYTAPTGKAYSPVTVNVANSYAAGDEGKVVSNGALVSQTAHAEVTQNGTIDTTLNNSVVVNVQGGGSSPWTKLAEQDFTVSTSSTTATDVGTISVPDIHLVRDSKLKIIFVKIRDKAGKRNGYYYGNDCLFVAGANVGYCYKYEDDTLTASAFAASVFNNGVYSATINTNDTIGIKTKYSATATGTIDGTYHVEVYTLEWPDNVSPFA